MNKLLYLLPLVTIMACNIEKNGNNQEKDSINNEIDLTLVQAERLASLPLNCINNPLPYKSGIVLADSSDLAMPIEHHPAFYGCFDWHSAVHGHWSLVYLMKTFPELSIATEARAIIDHNLSKENIATEVSYFSMNKYTKSFERTYGWAWLLKLAEELHTWNDAQAKQWLENLDPLTDIIAKKYIEYLPKLVYPIRVGEHSNTGFGLSFAYDYALTTDNEELEMAIKNRALDFYSSDEDCPMSWEPSGYDFLSPCLQELDIMRKVLDEDGGLPWIDAFLGEFLSGNQIIEPAIVKDRTDGKLVHLDGLNFSRAWCLYPLSGDYPKALELADQHLQFSLDKITDGDYSGEHWLASFALYAFKTRSETLSKLGAIN